MFLRVILIFRERIIFSLLMFFISYLFLMLTRQQLVIISQLLLIFYVYHHFHYAICFSNLAFIEFQVICFSHHWINLQQTPLLSLFQHVNLPYRLTMKMRKNFVFRFESFEALLVLVVILIFISFLVFLNFIV